MAKHPQKHLEFPHISMTVLDISKMGHLPVMSKGNRWALIAICLFTLYVFLVPMEESSSENIIQAYVSGILAQKGGSVSVLSNNGT